MSEDPADDDLIREATGERDKARAIYEPVDLLSEIAQRVRADHAHIEDIVDVIDTMADAMITADEALLARIQALEAVINTLTQPKQED